MAPGNRAAEMLCDTLRTILNRDGCDDHRDQAECDCAMVDRLVAKNTPKGKPMKLKKAGET